MQPKAILKMEVDGVMTVLLLLLMAYELVGRAAHEWIGLIMFVLLIAHHILNRGWLKNLRKGRYTPYRVLQTALAGLVLLSMPGQMVKRAADLPGGVCLPAVYRRGGVWADAPYARGLLEVYLPLAPPGAPLGRDYRGAGAAAETLPPPGKRPVGGGDPLRPLRGFRLFQTGDWGVPVSADPVCLF